MKKINTERVLLSTLVAVAFFGFLLWSIEQTETEQDSLTAGNVMITAQNKYVNDTIRVNAPKANSNIKSPIVVSGQAILNGDRLKIRIKDDKNLILKEVFVQTKDAKQMSEFSINLAYKKPTSTQGTIEVFLVSSKDNTETHKIILPVTFKD